ncbi:MAG: CinA family protein [Eubacteriales bacterium]|nr:CinA family protein [Eubacteriales bacterium]
MRGERESEELVRRFTACGLTFGTAESLTGGMISATVAGVSGASAVLMGGVVSYDPRIKRDVLGVSQAIIDSVGVVSEECAKAMAVGARKVLGVDVAVSATGVAGPTGGTAENPVGAVWLGVSTGEYVAAYRYQFTGDRQSVREQSVEQALRLALEAIPKNERSGAYGR